LNLFNNLLLAEIGKQAAFARWVRKLVGHLNSLVLTVEPPLYLRDDGPQGKHLSIKLSSTPPQEMPVIKHPFQIYQYTPDPENPAASDWRTVRINGGTLNNQHPDNDDTQASPLTVVIPASTTLYKIWLDATIMKENDDPNQGQVTALTLRHGASGWPGYPAQPSPNLATGETPDHLYILIGEVTTSNDTDKVLTIPPQSTQTALGCGLQAYNISCTDFGLRLSFRMAWWRV
jgi:hypothetical protein